MATIGMWNTLGLVLKIISKKSVKTYYAIPSERILICRPLTRLKSTWLYFSLIYLIINIFACCTTLYFLRKLNQSNLNENVIELMCTLIILVIIGSCFAPCISFTFNPYGLASLVSDMKPLQTLTAGNSQTKYNTTYKLTTN